MTKTQKSSRKRMSHRLKRNWVGGGFVYRDLTPEEIKVKQNENLMRKVDRAVANVVFNKKSSQSFPSLLARVLNRFGGRGK